MLTISGSCQGILDNCTHEQLFFFKNIVCMQTDILLSCLKQFSHLRLSQPHRILFQTYLQPNFIIRLI